MTTIVVKGEDGGWCGMDRRLRVWLPIASRFDSRYQFSRSGPFVRRGKRAALTS